MRMFGWALYSFILNFCQILDSDWSECFMTLVQLWISQKLVLKRFCYYGNELLIGMCTQVVLLVQGDVALQKYWSSKARLFFIVVHWRCVCVWSKDQRFYRNELALVFQYIWSGIFVEGVSSVRRFCYLFILFVSLLFSLFLCTMV